MTNYETLLFSQEGHVALLKLNRPERRNALTNQMLAELTDALQACAQNETVRAVLLCSGGKSFCAGQDLSVFDGIPSSEEVYNSVMNYYKPLIMALTGLEKPVIGAIQGAAAGAGVALALACDLRMMAADAYLMLAFSNIGLVPDAGSSWFLVRHLGYGRAFQLAAEAERLDASSCLDAGLANRVVAAAELQEEALAWAHKLAARPTLALGMTKRAMLRAVCSSLEETIEIEAQMQAQAVQTRDHQEGVTAFLQRRPPQFSGR